MRPNNSYPKLNILKTTLRPKSFSEGNIVTTQFPSKDKLIINQDYNELPEENLEQQPIINNTNIYSIIYTKIIGFLFHLVLLSIFEVLFFNYFIIQYENNALISLVNKLTSPIINSCQSLSNTNKILVDDFINIFINSTIINNNALLDYNTRQVFNHNLYIKSIEYCIGIIVTFFLLLISNLYFKQKIDFYMIILDNIIMICILGVYEYVFFTNIIFNYITITPNELIKIIIGNLIDAC